MANLKTRLKHIPLDFLGPEWAECSLDFRALTFRDLAALDTTDQSGRAVLDFLRVKFVRGTALDEAGRPVDLTADDLDQLDIETVKAIVDTLTGQPGPNA